MWEAPDYIDFGDCKYCSKILSGVNIKHTILECQYRQSMYCIVCMSYGHSPADCPNKTAWAIRKGLDASKIKNRVLIVESSEEGVKEVLRRYRLKPGTRRQENRKLLRNLANSMKEPHCIHFVSPK